MVKTLSSNWLMSDKTREQINQILTIKKDVIKTHPIVIGAILQDLSCPQNFGIISRIKSK